MVEDFEHIILTISLCLPRMGAVLLLLPFLSRQMLTGLVRNGVVLSLCLFLYPVVEQGTPDSADPLLLLAIILKEIFLGMSIGYALAVTLWAVEAAGFFIDNQRGATMASSLNPLSGEQTSPLGILLMQALAAYVFASGIFLMFLGIVYQSYALWPVWSFFPRLPPDLPVFFLGALDWLMRLTVLLAAPAILAMLLAEIGLALVSRFAPQLQVFFLAMPIKSAVGLFVLVLYMAFLLDYVDDGLEDGRALIERLKGLLQ